ncbi:MAG: hypothetical protein F4X00_07130 [Gemmatimonadetes bacterium]|nr:hypothetical protein [Gemmatimonadota bacterium]
MKKLFSLVGAAILLGSSAPAHSVPGDAPAVLEPADVTGPVMCADAGNLAAQEEECPNRIVWRRVNDDGSIDRVSCPFEGEGRRLSGVRFIVISTFPPIVVPVPEYTDTCDYGDCGSIDRDDLVGAPS